MRSEKGWPVLVFDATATQLPERPGVKRPAVDPCPFCSFPHLTMDAFKACREMHKDTSV